MTYAHLAKLAHVLREADLNVVEIDGWRGRGRPRSTGDFNPRGVLVHHTGSSGGGRSYAEWLAKVGRSDLPAPLCQLALDRDGTVYVCANGRANHAGQARQSGPMPAGDGNALYVGIEAMNNGTEGWTRVQRRAYIRTCAALCVAYAFSPKAVRAHRETSTTGKWDPGRLPMRPFRREVAKEMDRMTRKPTRVERARRLLADALDDAKDNGYHNRRRAISKALNTLPKD